MSKICFGRRKYKRNSRAFIFSKPETEERWTVLDTLLLFFTASMLSAFFY